MAVPGGAPQGESPDPARSASAAFPSPVRSAVRRLLSFAETRARIAASEFEEQLLRVFEVAAWALAAFFCFSIALALVALLIVMVFWEANRELAAGLLAALFVAAGSFSVIMLRACLASRPPFLSATLTELEKDQQKLGKP